MPGKLNKFLFLGKNYQNDDFWCPFLGLVKCMNKDAEHLVVNWDNWEKLKCNWHRPTNLKEALLRWKMLT